MHVQKNRRQWIRYAPHPILSGQSGRLRQFTQHIVVEGYSNNFHMCCAKESRSACSNEQTAVNKTRPIQSSENRAEGYANSLRRELKATQIISTCAELKKVEVHVQKNRRQWIRHAPPDHLRTDWKARQFHKCSCKLQVGKKGDV